MPQIEFTQFLRPDGRQEQQFIADPPEIDPITWAATCHLADRINAAGYLFEMEHLGIGNMVSFTVAGYHAELDEDNDIVIEVCQNGPNVPERIVALVNKAATQLVAWGKLDA